MTSKGSSPVPMMNRQSALALILFLVAAPFQAQAGDSAPMKGGPRVDIEINAGLLYGQTGEYVFTGDRVSSRVIWDLKPLYYTGADAAVSVNRFRFGFGIKAGFEGSTGIARDTDIDGSGNITRESVHDCRSTRFMFYDFRAGYDLVMSKKFHLRPMLVYKFRETIFEARDGYVVSPEGDRYSINGTLIRYEQVGHIPAMGIVARYRLLHGLYVSGGIEYGPYVICNAIDRHLSTKFNFYDSLRGGGFLSFSGSLEKTFAERYTMALSSSYEKIFTLRGDTCSKDLNTGEKSRVYKDAAGTDFSAWDFSLSAGAAF